MNDTITKLKEWGCDTIGALARVLDDEEFYLECLNAVIVDKNFHELKESLEQKSVQKAFENAHALKGMLANVGLTPMLNITEEIVEPLRLGSCDNLMGKSLELLEMRDKLMEILKS